MRARRMLQTLVGVAVGTTLAALAPATASAADPAPPAGMVRATNNGGLVLVYDTATGQRIGRYTMPFNLPDFAAFESNQIAFSPDRRYAAATDAEGVKVAKFTGSAYSLVRTYTQAELPDDPADRGAWLSDLHFIADGRLMFVAVGDPDSENHAIKAAYAVDPKQPSQQPVLQPYTSTAWDSAGRHTTIEYDQVTGSSGTLNVKVVRSTAELVGAQIGGAAHYTCTEPLDASRLLCLADPSEQTPADGALAVLARTDDGSYTLRRQVSTLPAHEAPVEPETLHDVYLSEDRSGMLIGTPQGWYGGAATATSVTYRYPHLGAVPVAPTETLVGWGSRHYSEYTYSYA